MKYFDFSIGRSLKKEEPVVRFRTPSASPLAGGGLSIPEGGTGDRLKTCPERLPRGCLLLDKLEELCVSLMNCCADRGSGREIGHLMVAVRDLMHCGDALFDALSDGTEKRRTEICEILPQFERYHDDATSLMKYRTFCNTRDSRDRDLLRRMFDVMNEVKNVLLSAVFRYLELQKPEQLDIETRLRMDKIATNTKPVQFEDMGVSGSLQLGIKTLGNNEAMGEHVMAELGRQRGVIESNISMIGTAVTEKIKSGNEALDTIQKLWTNIF